MCGIAGIVGRPGQQDAVARMIAAIAHRGPDGLSVSAAADHALGHARLAIIDLECGQQPMASRSGRWLIVFNGEIYNYRELRAALAGRYEFVTHSDTEAILAAVECHGVEAALAMIDGMYALALVDRQERRLHLARDHFGIKPLYYTALAGGGHAFASELKAFAAIGVPLAVDPAAVATQLLCRFIPAPYTGRAGIFKLRPGEWRTLSMDGPAETARRIVPAAQRRAATDIAASPQAASDALEAGVVGQLVADVPVGMLLSGGVDSALVASFAAEARPDMHSYCVGYAAQDRATEFVEAEASARLLHLNHSSIVVERQDFAAALRHSMWHLEEPIATTSLVTYSLLCKAVAAQRKVVLSGQGADEPWAGYSRHRFEALLERHGPAIRMLAPAAARIFGHAGRSRLRAVLGSLDDERARWIAYRALFPLERVRTALGAEATETALHRIHAALDWAEGQAPAAAAAGPFARLLVRDSYTDLSDNLLLLGDKLSMAHGLEVRVPMLDVAYATRVLQLPRTAKRAGLTMQRSKVMHKAIAARRLPRAIVNRHKKGFETPLATWFATEFGRGIRDSVLASSAPLAAVLPAATLLGGVPPLRAVGHELQQQLFSLWAMNEWMQVFR
ncbi:MAG: asparagine synthase (glutamine-hydrolyzing) [Gammaproteobacteria bacterium]|nr:asparagine synthase (glutamine-hydrolyzing) [Gammaproteobacteria bacterium]